MFLVQAVFVLLGAACLPSCIKEGPDAPNTANPPEMALPGCEFGITLLDCEAGRDSSYVFEGVWKEGAFRFGFDKLDEMTPNILPDGRNRLVFKVFSDSPDFGGVNASSSARCINVLPVGTDCRSYELEWVAEGESTITLWCGEGPSRREVCFRATSRKEIPFTGIRVRFHDGRESSVQIARFLHGDSIPAYGSAALFDGDWSHCRMMEIIGPEPLNATLVNESGEALMLFVTTVVDLPLVNGEYLIDGPQTRFLGWKEYLSRCPDARILDAGLNVTEAEGLDLDGTHPARSRLKVRFAEEKRIGFADIRERRLRGYRAPYGYCPGTEGKVGMSFYFYKVADAEKVYTQTLSQGDWFYLTDCGL